MPRERDKSLSNVKESSVEGVYKGTDETRAGLDWDKKRALAFLLRLAHHNRSDTTNQYTILAVAVDMHIYRSIPKTPYKAEN